jgi:phosphatidylglycerophosphatase A
MNHRRNYLYCLSTLGRVGYLKAPGTMGAVVSLPLIIAYKYLLYICAFDALIYDICSSMVFTGLSLWMLYIIKPYYDADDPQEIVIDEGVGMFIALTGMHFSSIYILGAFVLFRFFDISKILGISYMERIPEKSCAIMADDCLAGIYTCIVMHYVFVFYS